MTADRLREDQIMYYVWRERLSYNNIKELRTCVAEGWAC